MGYSVVVVFQVNDADSEGDAETRVSAACEGIVSSGGEIAAFYVESVEETE